MSTARRPLDKMLVADLAGGARELWAHCPHCRINRQVDVTKLLEKDRGGRLVASLPLRCTTCGRLGKPWVSGWEDGGRTTWET